MTWNRKSILVLSIVAMFVVLAVCFTARDDSREAKMRRTCEVAAKETADQHLLTYDEALSVCLSSAKLK